MRLMRRFWTYIEVCPEIAETGLIDLPLESSIGKSYGFTGFESYQEFFRA